MKLEERPGGFALYKEKTEVGCCQLTRTAAGADVACLTIVPEWRRKGYGSYLLKEILRRFGGYDRETATVFTAPLPAAPGEEAFWAKFGFREEAARLCRRRTSTPRAVNRDISPSACPLYHKPRRCGDTKAPADFRDLTRRFQKTVCSYPTLCNGYCGLQAFCPYIQKHTA